MVLIVAICDDCSTCSDQPFMVLIQYVTIVARVVIGRLCYILVQYVAIAKCVVLWLKSYK